MLDRLGKLPLVEARAVLEELCLIELTPPVVLLELCEVFEVELE